VVSGLDRVLPLGNVADANNDDVPDVPVRVERIDIQRVGAAANAYNPNAAALPLVKGFVPAPHLSLSGTTTSLDWIRQPNHGYPIVWSVNLQDWEVADEDFYQGATPVVGPMLIEDNRARTNFYRVAEVQYAETLIVPRTVSGRQIIFDGPDADFTYTIHATNGTLISSVAAGGAPLVRNLPSYVYFQYPYSARFTPNINGEYVFGGFPIGRANYSMAFTSATTGTFSVLFYSVFGNVVTQFRGTFTIL
jgi:hypothetical protein